MCVCVCVCVRVYEYLLCALAYLSSVFMSCVVCLSFAMITFLVGADVVIVSEGISRG